ncbi:hypothetical protein M426DRAFT_17292 [Hypoxylon sp. CI-4A]|nr:hypothetical protein M426DRAFT_17292 [Hypoxylon sp. CI-4A]
MNSVNTINGVRSKRYESPAPASEHAEDTANRLRKQPRLRCRFRHRKHPYHRGKSPFTLWSDTYSNSSNPTIGGLDTRYFDFVAPHARACSTMGGCSPQSITPGVTGTMVGGGELLAAILRDDVRRHRLAWRHGAVPLSKKQRNKTPTWVIEYPQNFRKIGGSERSPNIHPPDESVLHVRSFVEAR